VSGVEVAESADPGSADSRPGRSDDTSRVAASSGAAELPASVLIYLC
jgi:hypothetical protein